MLNDRDIAVLTRIAEALEKLAPLVEKGSMAVERSAKVAEKVEEAAYAAAVVAEVPIAPPEKAAEPAPRITAK